MKTPLLRWCGLAMAGALGASCGPGAGARLYRTAELPPLNAVTTRPMSMLHEPGPPEVEVSREAVKALRHLGASLMTDAKGQFLGTHFGVFSQRAEKVQLVLMDDPSSNLPTRQFDMVRIGDVWSLFVEGVGLGQHYGYIAWGPNWRFDPSWSPGSVAGFTSDVDAAGNRFNPNKLLFDPYCRALNRDHDWAKASLGTGPSRAQPTYGAAMKCVIVKSNWQWSDEEVQWRRNRLNENWPGHRWNDLILYEVHVKGFTANSASGVTHLGTYRGLGEKAGYFKELGITAVELMPPFEKPLDGGYWGYNSLSFFAPEVTYAFRREREQTIDEFKWMVEQLHRHGIEVILDVVYNHTGEGGLWRERIYQHSQQSPWPLDPQDIASLYSYRGLDNASYYALPPLNRREYCDYTSVGNTMRNNGPVVPRLVIDSLRYWVEEMHVDGFRFDLAPTLGGRDLAWDNCPTSTEKDGKSGITWDPQSTLIQAIIDDPVLLKYNTRVIAEPWGGGGYPVGQFTASTHRPGIGWAEWNDKFRDWVRRFSHRDDQPVRYVDRDYVLDGRDVLTGTYSRYAHNQRRPHHSVNFVTIHDGFTMYDLVSYDNKVNDCSPLNPICCTAPLSAYCFEAKNSGEKDNNNSKNWGNEDKKRQMIRGFFAYLLTAHGTPMIYGGDEWLRTQLGNNNPYTPEADNPYSWFDWGNWQGRDANHRMFDFVKQVIRLRKEHAYAFMPMDYNSTDFQWKSPQNGPLDLTGRQLMMHYDDPNRGPELAILVNMGNGQVDFQLPPGRQWWRLIDTQSYFDTTAYLTSNQLPLRRSANATLDNPVEVPGSVYGVPSRVIVVLEAR